MRIEPNPQMSFFRPRISTWLHFSPLFRIIPKPMWLELAAVSTRSCVADLTEQKRKATQKAGWIIQEAVLQRYETTYARCSWR
ncbi:hypothetical protein BS78_03G229900 [Paspalum vaginatum]|nr:hypothetical protein BS78_03G229900 [Paspalum vaginatum]